MSPAPDANEVARLAAAINAAEVMFDLYSAYLSAGFSPEQAMDLLKTMVQAQIGKQ